MFNQKVFAWVYLYWLLCINTINAITYALYFGRYDYQLLIPGSLFASVYATLQILSHLMNNKKKVPSYKMYLQIYLVTLLYLTYEFMDVWTWSDIIAQLSAILMVAGLLAIPLTLLAIFVRYRVLKYDMAG